MSEGYFINYDGMSDIADSEISMAVERTKRLFFSTMTTDERASGYEEIRMHVIDNINTVKHDWVNALVLQDTVIPTLIDCDYKYDLSASVARFISIASVLTENLRCALDTLDDILMRKCVLTDPKSDDCMKVLSTYTNFQALNLEYACKKKIVNVNLDMVIHLYQNGANSCKMCSKQFDCETEAHCTNDSTVCVRCCPCHKDE